MLIFLYEGVILAGLSNPEESDAAFKAALLLQSEGALPVRVSPKVEERFEMVRQKGKREVAREVPSPEASTPLAAPSQTALAQPQPSPEAPSPALKTPPPPMERPSEPTPLSLAPHESSSPGTRSRAWLPAAIGGGLLLRGGASYLPARGEQSKLRGNDAGLASLEDVKRSASRGRTYQAVALAGVGIVGLGVSAGIYLLRRPSQSQTLMLDVSTDGTSAFAQGRWP